MKILDTSHKRKSAVITALLLLLLGFGIFNYGMRYLDPPEEYGLAINFGTTDYGSGVPQQNIQKKAVTEVVEKQEQVVEEVKEVQKEAEELLTEDTSEEVPVVEKVEEVKETVEEKVEKVVPKEDPKPSKAAQDALNSLLNGGSSEAKSGGEGDEVLAGLKGKVNGDPDANKYYGNTGSGTGANYNLAGRKALSTPKEQPNCEEEGIVVVKITVDKSGKVLSAIPGVKGSTNTADCLLKPAKEAALKTRWNADSKAPSNQIGTIIYRFSLSK